MQRVPVVARVDALRAQQVLPAADRLSVLEAREVLVAGSHCRRTGIIKLAIGASIKRSYRDVNSWMNTRSFVRAQDGCFESRILNILQFSAVREEVHL